MKSKYAYRAYWSPAHQHYSVDRNELILWFATHEKHARKIYPAAAQGYLTNGDTLDGIQREIELTRRIMELQKELELMKEKLSSKA